MYLFMFDYNIKIAEKFTDVTENVKKFNVTS